MSNTKLTKKTDEQYKSIDALNYSSFKHFLTSPMHYKNYVGSKQEETQAMKLGTAIHSAVLTPEHFADNYIAAPICDRRTKEGKLIWQEFTEAHANKIILTTDELFTCLNIQHKLRLNEYFSKLKKSKSAVCEQVAVGEIFGVAVKGRIDLYDEESNTIFDLKSMSVTPTVENCRKAIFTNGYHIQAFFYSMLIKQLYGRTPEFVFGFVEKDEPNGIGLVKPSHYWLNLAGSITEKELTRYANCKLLDIWPSFTHSEVPSIVSPWEEHKITETIPQHLID